MEASFGESGRGSQGRAQRAAPRRPRPLSPHRSTMGLEGYWNYGSRSASLLPLREKVSAQLTDEGFLDEGH